MELTAKHQEYWRKNLVITAILLFIWFVATFVEAWYARELNQFTFSASRSASTCRRRAR